MHLVRSHLVLAAALALLAQQSTAQDLFNLGLANNLDQKTLTDALIGVGAAPVKRQAKGTLLKGLNVFGQDVPDAPTDPVALTKMLKETVTPAAAAERRDQQPGGVMVLGKVVPSNAAELTKMLQDATAAKQPAKRETGLGLDVDHKPAPQFLMDSLLDGIKRRDDFSTRNLPSDLSFAKLEPAAAQAVKFAAPIALAPVSPQLKMAGAGYKLASAMAHEAGVDAMATEAVQEVKDELPSMPTLPSLPTKRSHTDIHHHRKRGSVDATDLKNSDFGMLKKIPNQAVKIAAPIALSKVGGYVGTAQTGVKTAQMVSNMAGVPQMVEKTGAPQMIQDATKQISDSAPKLPSLPKLPAAAAAAKRDQWTDELTKAGLGLGDMVRDNSLNLGMTATNAGNAFAKNLYGARPAKRNMVISPFELLPGAGPKAKEAADELAGLLPFPVPGMTKRMEKIARRDE